MSETSDHPAIAAAVIVRDGCVLLVRRRHAEGSLSWQFPAGSVETGESGEEAAAREALEETGLAVEPLRVLGEREHPATKRKMIYVACEVVTGTAYVADAEELDAVTWASISKLDSYVPDPFYGPVQDHLDAALAAA